MDFWVYVALGLIAWGVVLTIVGAVSKAAAKPRPKPPGVHFCDEEDVLGDPYDMGIPCPHPDPEFDPETGLTFCLTCLRRMPSDKSTKKGTE